MPNSRFALHGLALSNLRFVRYFCLQFTVYAPFPALLTPVSTAPFFVNLSIHSLYPLPGNRPFLGIFCPFSVFFRPFLEGPESTWEIQKTEEKAFFLRYPLLNPHLWHSNLE